jgi:hypothetical protein
MFSLLAQGGIVIGGSITSIAIAIVVILAVVALVYIAARAMGVPIPQWVMQVLAVIVIAVVIIWAIRFVAGGF